MSEKSNKIIIFLIVFGVIILLGVILSDNSKKDTTENNSESEKIEWVYSEDIDKMEGTKQYFGIISSKNKIDFQFPYDGGSSFEITIRNLGKENEVLLSVSKGLFMISYDSSESIKVKFDDNESEYYTYNSPTDGSSDVIFIDNSKRFLKKLKSSKKVLIETTFYNEGNKVIEFDVEGLKWDK
jgi:hypothetical protein